jgi:hypothetical protein
MPLVVSRLKLAMDNELFKQPSNDIWDKGLSNGSVEGVKNYGEPSVLGNGIKCKPNQGGTALINGLTGINKATFKSFLVPNWKTILKLPGSVYSDTMGMNALSCIGDELALMTITTGKYANVATGTATVTGIPVDQDMLEKKIQEELKNADTDKTRGIFQEHNSKGLPTGELIEIQKKVAKAVAKTIKENLAVANGVGVITGGVPETGNPPSGPEMQDGIIS